MLRIAFLANCISMVVSKGMLHRLDFNQKQNLLSKVIEERDRIGGIYGGNFTRIKQHFVVGDGSFSLAESLTESYFGHKKLVLVRLLARLVFLPANHKLLALFRVLQADQRLNMMMHGHNFSPIGSKMCLILKVK